MDAREKLKAAIADFNMQNFKVERSRRTLDLARQAMEEAKIELQSYADLDKQITRFRVAATKRGANPKNLSEELKTKLAAKRTAESELAQAEATLEVLDGELKELRKTLRPFEDARMNAAFAVLVQEQGDVLAKEYMQMSARARELFLLFAGLWLMEIERDGQKKGISGSEMMATAAVLGRNDRVLIDQLFPDGSNVIADMGERWKACFEVLINDADAAVARPKPISPSNYTRTNAATAPHFGIPIPGTYKLAPEV